MSLGLHHAERRRKARLSGLPTRSSMLKTALDVIIYPVAIASPVALLPQVIRLYETHDASSLLFVSWLVFGMLNLVWVFYGIVHKEKPIVVTNAMLAILNFAVALGILLFA